MSTWKELLGLDLVLPNPKPATRVVQPTSSPMPTRIARRSRPVAPVTEAAPLDPQRLRYEREQLRVAFGGSVTLAQFPGTIPKAWSSWGVVVAFTPFTITGRYEPEHPYKPPRFTITPAPRSWHYHTDTRGLHLCYTKPEEWRAQYTIATALGTVIRFLTEYQQGTIL